MWLALGALLAVVCVLFVARPFLRDPRPADDSLALPDEDYRAKVGPLRRRAAEALRALDPSPRQERVRARG